MTAPAASDRQKSAHSMDQHFYGNPARTRRFPQAFQQTRGTTLPFVDNKFWGTHLPLDWELGSQR